MGLLMLINILALLSGFVLGTENTTVEYLNELKTSENTTDGRAPVFPCSCANAKCDCCTGNLLQFFNFKPSQRGCVTLAYEPDDFSFGMAVSINERVLYNTKISGKNPPPVCLPVPRITGAGLCAKLSNVYIIERNLHACIGMEAQWNKQPAFAWNFDCVRMGVNGVAIVKPEDGGGLPHPPQPEDEIEEYDEVVHD